MKRTAAGTLFLLLLCRPCLACDPPEAQGLKPATLMTGLGDIHHPIKTESAEAQKFFDQGLAFMYAFNHAEAQASFEKAAELDPKSPMPQWGVALALGPNINVPVDPEHEKAAYAAIQRAIPLAAKAAPVERDYVEALAKRYSDDPKADLAKLSADYAAAMGEVSKKYPDDLDAATLHAEAMMDLKPWQLWSADGKPAEGTNEIIAILESVLRRSPTHTGANHYYIHAVEASPHPELALPCAARLATLAPAAGHLVHMPAHILMRTGDYAGASHANEAASEADRSYFKDRTDQGLYPLLYYDHNLHFLSSAAAFEGRYAVSKKAAETMVAFAAPAAKDVPLIEPFLSWPMLMDLRFHRWDDVLGAPAPDASQLSVVAIWHFARGVALAGKGSASKASKEKQQMAAAAAKIPPDFLFSLNPMSSFVAVAGNVLDARMAEAKKDWKGAIAAWTKAVEEQDKLAYDEPPGFYYPVRESLGAALLQAKKPADAERVFRADLEKNPRSGRSLFGLAQSLRAQKRDVDAAWVEAELQTAWKNADGPLKVSDL
ncbi:MAG: hypothetical protein U0166_20725 [Acidobacteriota bacterium]